MAAMVPLSFNKGPEPLHVWEVAGGNPEQLLDLQTRGIYLTIVASSGPDGWTTTPRFVHKSTGQVVHSWPPITVWTGSEPINQYFAAAKIQYEGLVGDTYTHLMTMPLSSLGWVSSYPTLKFGQGPAKLKAPDKSPLAGKPADLFKMPVGPVKITFLEPGPPTILGFSNPHEHLASLISGEFTDLLAEVDPDHATKGEISPELMDTLKKQLITGLAYKKKQKLLGTTQIEPSQSKEADVSISYTVLKNPNAYVDNLKKPVGKLSEAKDLLLPVGGTSSSSVYYVVALGEHAALAVRRSEKQMSLRVEARTGKSWPTVATMLARAEMFAVKSGYASSHVGAESIRQTMAIAAAAVLIGATEFLGAELVPLSAS